MSTFICPECNKEIDNNSPSCPHCGYPITDNTPSSSNDNTKQRKSKKAVIIIFSSLVAILLIVGGCVYSFTKMLPIQNSIKAYDSAVKYEEQFEYNAAISCYQSVIKDDEEHYQNAQKRISELEKQIPINKFVAKAILALQNEGIISSIDEVSRVGATMSSYGRDYPMMTCKIGETGYTVLATSDDKDKSMKENHANYSFDNDTHFTIVEYRASYQANGWLTSEYNYLRQEVSDEFFELDEVSTKKENINLNLAKHYLELYHNSNDITVFE